MDQNAYDLLRRFDITLFTLGDTTVQVSTIAKALIALLLLIWITRWLRARTVTLLSRSPLDVGTRIAFADGPRELDPLVGLDGMVEAVRFTGDGSEVLAVSGTTVAVGWR